MSDPRGPAQRPRRLVVDAPLAWAIVGAAIIALIVALAILLTRPAPVEAPGRSGAPSTSQAATGPAAPARPTRLADGTWWRVDWRDATDVAHPDEMRVGRLDGTLTASLVLPPARQIQRGYGPPLVRGPAGGVVLVATAVGETVSFKRIDARSGADSLLAVIRGQVPDATLAADGRHVYYLLLSERGLSAVRLATDGSGETVTVAAPRAPAARADGIVLAAAIQPTATIAVSSDERTLVIGDCFMSCTARVVDLASGGERAINGLDPTSTVTGWTQTGVWLGEQCLDPSTGVVANRPCLGEPPQQLDVNFRFGLEVPGGWRVEMRRVPGQNQMSFLLRAVAIAPDGTQTILDGLGIFSGNG